MFQKTSNIVLATLSGILFSLGWFSPFTIFIFFAFVPLFIIEDKLSNKEIDKRKKLKLIGLSYFAFFVWNLGVTWWLVYASFGGACLAIICNPIFMCITFMAWYNLKKRINKPWSIWLLIPLWLAFEYGHTLWDLSWSWLILGNAFSITTNWIQWYEFTGTSGGSVWVLITNILVFQIIKNKHYTIKQFAKPISVIALPIVLSYIILIIAPSVESKSNNLNEKTRTYKTLIVQPNIDPYNEKFYFEPAEQFKKLNTQLKNTLDSTIDFLVLPETYITENVFEGAEFDSYSFCFLRDSLLKRYPKLTIICGSNTVRKFLPNETLSSTARKFTDADLYYDSFNTGIQYSNEGLSLYHKSKLVPGVERMPFPGLLKPLESLAIDLGGSFGSQGTQKERTVFFSHDHNVGIAPVICYESVYSDYVTGYIRNGANLIFVITNDGWWSDSPGHKQHLALSQLRAIENRREIARCANTGISCFITPYGEIEQATPYWEDAVIIKNMTPNNAITFFSKFGDLLSYCSVLLAILLLIWSQILRFKKS
jgi:apolipoprotein N-acyltransferase